ncbi:spore coat protein [Tissierella sp. Yu-01]|uniref:spore coat protein n=1 Tax=Tissierella sp. Yu-01 TaxID=3035694 RepID=UPI00240E6BD4|nr:spore coat protein [Tissierella sp. Yu-01]WFA07711.1 spore coat protein [Tissierella sp. Yu-01]
MNIRLSQKERMYLEDGKSQEDLCVKKYQSFSNQAEDPELKKLFNKLAAEEHHHLDIINSLLQGKSPDLSQGHNVQQNLSKDQITSSDTPNTSSDAPNTLESSLSFNSPSDKLLLNDLLSTEKYVSSFYDTGVFESANKEVREALQHIQREEQRHGELLFNYMNSHGMYNVK